MASLLDMFDKWLITCGLWSPRWQLWCGIPQMNTSKSTVCWHIIILYLLLFCIIWDEVTGGCRKLHNEELNDLYCSPNIVWVIKLRRLRWEGHVAHMGEGRGMYRVLVGKPEGKRPLGRPRRRWVDNIRMDPQEVGCGYGDWIGLAQDRDRWRTLVSAVMNLRVP